MFIQYPYYVLTRKKEKNYGKICPRARPRPAELVLIIKFLGI